MWQWCGQPRCSLRVAGLAGKRGNLQVGLLSARTPRVTPGETLPPTLPIVPTVPATAPATEPATAPTTAPTTAAPLSLSSAPGSTCNTCPENWVNFQRKCYYFGEGAKKWIQARFACSKLQGRLVSIHSQEEQVGGALRRAWPAGGGDPTATSCAVGAGTPGTTPQPLQPRPAPQDFLAKRANRKGTWIGLRDLDIEGEFIWMDENPLNYR